MKICPDCHRCYEDTDLLCEQADHGALIAARPGSRFITDKYRLDRLLARGGMGAVYAGTHVELDRPIAVKLLLPNFQADPQAFERFRREARAAARIKHPNVADIYDFEVLADGEAYIVMELVEGETLHERLKREGQMAFDEIVGISRQIAGGMEAAHQSGVVHRDLKPSNIILNQNADGTAQVKIIDFGIAKISEQMAGESTLTATGMLVGTPHYMSPEQCLGEELDARSDIYSFGIILYEMLAGQPPFEATSAVAIAFKHIHEPPAPLDQYRRNVPAGLAELVMDALSLNPSQRPQTATELVKRLDQIDLSQSEAGVSAEVSRKLTPGEVDPLRTQVMDVEEGIAASSAESRVGNDAAAVQADEYATSVIESAPLKEETPTAAEQDDTIVAKPSPVPKVTTAQKAFFNARTGGIKQAVPLTGVLSAADDQANSVAPSTDSGDETIIRRRRRSPAYLYAAIAGAFIIGVAAIWAATQRASSKQPEAVSPVTATRPVRPASSPTVSPSNSPAPSVEADKDGTEQARSEIGGALDDWVAATNAGDVNRQMAFYNPTVDAFYLTRNVSREAVRAEKQRLFDQAEKIDVQAGEPTIKFGKDGQTATTRFRKRYTIEGPRENRQGEVIQELRWVKTDSGWKIVSERDVRVVQKPNQPPAAPKAGASMWPHQLVVRGVKKLFHPNR